MASPFGSTWEKTKTARKICKENHITAMGEPDHAQCYRLVHDAERRAKRIAARYAELYFRSKEKSQGKIQFYWVALAAFVVKDVVHAFAYTRKQVLEGGWRSFWGDAAGQDAYLHALRTYLALAKGNLWLFMDIYPWYWFYLEYVINPDGSLNTRRLDMCAPKRNTDTYQRQSKNAVAWLPYSRNWLNRAAEKIGGDGTYRQAADQNATYVKIGSTSDRAHRDIRQAIPHRQDPHDVPHSAYWRSFKEAFDVLEAQRKEMLRLANDQAAMVRLEKVAKFTVTQQIRDAYGHISKGLQRKGEYQRKELLAIAEQEQINILQPLIYDDPKLKETLDLNHTYSRRFNWLTPPFQVVFAMERDTDDPELKVQFDPPGGAVDWLKGSSKSLANVEDRMQFVRDIAKQFNKLMADKKRKAELEANLLKLQGWLNA
jgi:hypothetical protein